MCGTVGLYLFTRCRKCREIFFVQVCKWLMLRNLSIKFPRLKKCKNYGESYGNSDFFRKFAVPKIGLEPRKMLIVRELGEI